MLARQTLDRDIVAFDGFRLDVRERSLFKNGRRVALPRKVLDLIAFMAAHAGTVLTPDRLVDAVWNAQAITDANIAQHICHARKALDDMRKPHRIIKTVHGRGYVFCVPAETAAMPTDRSGTQTYQLMARELYQNGKSFMKCGTQSSLRSSIVFFERAAQLCPLYEPAYSGMAEAYLKLALRLYEMPSAAFENARTFARRAVLLDPDSEHARIVLAAVAVFADYDSQTACEHLAAAVRHRPDHALLHAVRTHAYLLDRRFERAQLAVDEALDWLPDSLALRTLAGLVHFYAGAYDRAIRHLEQLVTLEPAAPFARYVLAAAKLFAGDALSAREQLRHIIDCELRAPDDCDANAVQHALTALIFLEGQYGNHDTAVRLFHEFGSYVRGEHISPVSLAAALAAFGANIEVGQRLRDGRRTSDPRLIFIPYEPYFKNMRGDPQFEKLCDEVLSRKL